jgi:serine/threonine-protein kinase RsbW
MPDTRADIALALTEACANVIQHAGSGEEYEVEVSARNRRCVIEVVNTSIRDREVTSDDSLVSTFQHRLGPGQAWPAGAAPADDADDAVSAIAEHGRGLKIIDAVADNLQLTRSTRRGTTVHFEKKLEWLPDAAGQYLLDSNDE